MVESPTLCRSKINPHLGEGFLFNRIFINKRIMGNVILTEKQLEKLINKMRTVNENHEEGSYMAKQQLFTIATLAHAMWEKMEDGEQLEDWMESKISQAEQSIIGVVKTFMYDEFKGESQPNDGMGKLNYDEIIIGK